VSRQQGHDLPLMVSPLLDASSAHASNLIPSLRHVLLLSLIYQEPALSFLCSLPSGAELSMLAARYPLMPCSTWARCHRYTARGKQGRRRRRPTGYSLRFFPLQSVRAQSYGRWARANSGVCNSATMTVTVFVTDVRACARPWRSVPSLHPSVATVVLATADHDRTCTCTPPSLFLVIQQTCSRHATAGAWYSRQPGFHAWCVPGGSRR